VKRYAIITDDAVEGVELEINGTVSFFVLNHEYPNFADGEKWNSHSGSIISKGLIQKYPQVLPPSRESISELLDKVKDEFEEVFCVLSADGLSPMGTLFDEISKSYKGRMKLRVIHSENISFGQGYLINKCVGLINQDAKPEKIEEMLRETVPSIYTLLCAPDLFNVFSNGFIDAGQYLVGSQHFIQPLFSLENGFLNPLDKTKNGRGVAEFFIDFLQEFDQVEGIAFLHSKNKTQDIFQDIKHLSTEIFPNILISEVHSNTYFSHLIGPNGFGLILIE